MELMHQLNLLRIATYNGENKGWALRSPYVGRTKDVLAVYYNGSFSGPYANEANGVRPALILPTNLLVLDDGSILPDTYPEPPTSITVPTSAVPTGSSIAVSWAAVTGSTYKLQRSVDGGSWTDVMTNRREYCLYRYSVGISGTGMKRTG